ncbi:uncharacterized protein LOC103928329 isoform X3 [Pyrus x bretschneideri]|uniref:uncharacterized protein LOC103928329 isoform X3 n=1 Tax=Pyrus x bretschneideri TaxID=225117 RepID=UPI0020300CAD|nr:uncharacterized protein LOC103928329 isoform X3 [Pyrus x bretschneideri]
MAFRSLHQIGALYRTAQIAESSHLLGSSRNYATGISNVPESSFESGSSMTLRSAMAVELPLFSSDTRSLSTQVKAPAQARQMMVHKKGVEKNKRRHNYRAQKCICHF